MKFSEAIAPLINEADIHPHCREERADLFHSFTGGGAELEVAQFLKALVFLFKPSNILETGTGEGYATLAIADGIKQNGFGKLHTIELDAHWIDKAKNLMATQDESLLDSVEFHVGKSLDWIANYSGPQFDFVFFDSLLSLRHLEFQAMQERSLLSPQALCVFHDTSRLRGKTMHDYNPEMIEALDRAQQGHQWLESNLSRGLRLIKLG